MSKSVVEQIIAPPALWTSIDPACGEPGDVLRGNGQGDFKGYRTLVTTLTKRMAESWQITCHELGKGALMHSDIDTFSELRSSAACKGDFDVVGINLREGLDIPEVALVAILDADKGFLRSKGPLFRPLAGHRNMKAGHIVCWQYTVLSNAVTETNRRQIQIEFNEKWDSSSNHQKSLQRELVEVDEQWSLRLICWWRTARREKWSIWSSILKQRCTLLQEPEFEKAAKLRDIVRSYAQAILCEHSLFFSCDLSVNSEEALIFYFISLFLSLSDLTGGENVIL